MQNEETKKKQTNNQVWLGVFCVFFFLFVRCTLNAVN